MVSTDVADHTWLLEELLLPDTEVLVAVSTAADKGISDCQELTARQPL